jgi:hypothetical protein
MPLFMDVHENLPEGVSLQDVIRAHEADLGVQQGYGVRYIKYWFSEDSGKVFCLAEAPNADAAVAVHREAHGLEPDRIFEVVEGS